MIRKLGMLLGTALVILGFASFAAAQVDTGAVIGVVSDSDGSPLPGVSVAIIGKAIMGGQLAATTDANGVYRFLRVPVGEYILEYKLQGFKPQKRENVKVTITGRLEVNVKLELASLAAEVEVTAQAPVIDQVKPNFNKTVDAKTLDILPINRGGHATEIANFNPGDERYGATMGSGWYGNAYILDGADATDPGGGDVWLRPNYETVEEVEFTYGGAPAEYGDFSGSLVRMITKTGSNRFFGAAGLYYTNHRMTDRNTKESVGYWTKKNNTYDISLGGPVIKDKIWFYGDFFLNPSEEFYAQTQQSSEYVYRQYTFKLTFNLSPKHRTNVSAWYEPNTARRWGSESPYAASSTWYDMEFWTKQFALNHTSFLRENLILDANVSYMKARYYYPPSNPGGWEPQEYNYETGMMTGGMGYYTDTDEDNLNAYAKLSWFVNLAGSHEWKAGLEYQYAYRGSYMEYTGGMMIDNYGDMRIAYMMDPYYARQDVGRVSGFLQDDWTIGKRLTLGVGVRYDDMHGYINEQKQRSGTVVEGPGSVAHFKCLAPRLSVNYEVTGDGKTMLRASWGRYFQVPPTGMFSGLNPARSAYKYAMEIDGEWYVYRIVNPTARRQDPKLKNYHNDLLTLSLEREILPGTTVALNYFKRWSKNYYGQIPLHSYVPVTVIDSYTEQPVTVYDYAGSTRWYFCNIPESYNLYDTYDAFQIVLNKRLTSKWYLNASYHYEKSWGTTENGYNEDMYAGYVHYGITVDPNKQINWEGPPMYSSPHQFKMVTSYLFPMGITASAFVEWKSGNPWNRIHTINNTQVYAVFNAEPRGTRRLPSKLNLDFWLRKELQIKGSVALELSLQVTNLLNADTITGYYSQTGNYLESYFGDIRYIVAPRQGILGIKIRY